MKEEIVSLLIAISILVSMGGCAWLSPQAKVTSTGGPHIAQAQMEPYNGPKARIAVARFRDSTGKGWWTGKIGDGMADMLVTAFFNANRFIVLERRILKDVLAEQDLGATGRVKKETAIPIGQIEGAELLVAGVVTEFEPDKALIGGGIGGISGTWQEAVAGLILSGIKVSHVAIDLRVIDTATSRILLATSVEGRAIDFSLGGLGKVRHSGGGLGGYSNTSVEQAIRVALDEGINYIVSQLPDRYYHYQDNNATLYFKDMTSS